MDSGILKKTFFPLLLTLVFFFAAPCSSAQSPSLLLSGVPPAPHRGAVTGILYDGEYIISAGEDGFVEFWNPRTGAAEERFQVSSAPLVSIILRPGKRQIACLESDGIGFFRVSSWDYGFPKRIFVLEFREPVNYINYSAGGRFLIATGNGRSGLVIIDAETGKPLPSPPDLAGPLTFAATGRSERNMVVYSPGGNISYWDLELGKETNHFPAPAGMSSPILFGNRRFFAGIDSRGLVVVDAVSGRELVRDASISRGFLMPDDKSDTGFFCVVPGGVFSFRMYPEGRLQRTRFLSFPAGSWDIRSAAPAGDFIALGSAGGIVLLQESNGALKPMKTKKQKAIAGAAVGRNLIAFLTGDGRLGYIPLNFSLLRNGSAIRLENAGGYTRLAPVAEDGGGDRFILWNDTGARLNRGIVFDKLSRHSSIRSVSALGDKGLFLDSVGNISVLSLNTGDLVFSFSSIGSMDAVFLNDNGIVLGRGALSGNSPFLMIDTATGETLPLPYPATVGALLYRGASGAVYAATVNEKEGERVTSVIRLDSSDSPRSPRLVEYRGEDTVFSIAEAGGILASTLGNGEAAAYTAKGMVSFERGAGIPRSLMGGEACFVVLDTDGNISWHDPENGGMLAAFRLYETEWSLGSLEFGLAQGKVIP
ncbi:MAG: WD40 repeat domain-containing protein [Treponema sp.]|nr:WD40 repeat domain-containing protein [Treponema sp.]